MFLTKQRQDPAKWLDSARTDGAFILVDKEKDWTSFDVVAKLRRITKIKKIGHAGTLDPFATGLLIVALSRGATRQIDDFQGLDKKYTGRIKLGAVTETFDSESIETNHKPFETISPETIESVRQRFLGVQMQKAPIFSAKKIKGKALYKYARKNQEVEVPISEIEVKLFDITEINMPFISFELVVSKGTYIRSIANDFGERLGCGAYLESLRRVSIGQYNVEDALKIKEIEELFVQTISKLQESNGSI